MYSIVHIAGWKRYILLRDLEHVLWVGCALYRSSTAPRNGRLDYLNHDLSYLSEDDLDHDLSGI